MQDRVFLEKVSPILLDLWPLARDRMTDEVMRSWARCAGSYSVEQVLSVLRSMLDGGVSWPEPHTMLQKLRARHGEHGYQKPAETHTQTREREDYKLERRETDTIIDSMSDEELAGHALMHAASSPHLLGTLALDPRKNLGMRSVIANRVRAGWKHDQPISRRRDKDWRWKHYTIEPEAIERAKRIRDGLEPMPNGASVFTQMQSIVGTIRDNRPGVKHQQGQHR